MHQFQNICKILAIVFKPHCMNSCSRDATNLGHNELICRWLFQLNVFNALNGNLDSDLYWHWISSSGTHSFGNNFVVKEHWSMAKNNDEQDLSDPSSDSIKPWGIQCPKEKSNKFQQASKHKKNYSIVLVSKQTNTL